MYQFQKSQTLFKMIFNYDQFYNWYQNHFDNPKICDKQTDAIALFYNPAIRYSGKKNKPSKKQRFKVTESQKVAKFLPVETSRLYPNGVFLVADYKAKIGDDWLLFVFPKHKIFNDESVDGIFADHYTFCYNTENKKTPVNFHVTEYYPQTLDGSMGTSMHLFYDYADDCYIPNQGKEGLTIFKDRKQLPDIDTILKIARLPFIEDNHTTGGAPSSSKPQYPVYDGGKYFSNKTFNKAFNKLNVSSILVFGFRGYYSVYLYDKKYNKQGNLMDATNSISFGFYLDTDPSKPEFEKQIRKKIAELFKSIVD